MSTDQRVPTHTHKMKIRHVTIHFAVHFMQARHNEKRTYKPPFPGCNSHKKGLTNRRKATPVHRSMVNYAAKDAGDLISLVTMQGC